MLYAIDLTAQSLACGGSAAVRLRRLRRSSETRRKPACGGSAADGVRIPPYPLCAILARFGARKGAVPGGATSRLARFLFGGKSRIKRPAGRAIRRPVAGVRSPGGSSP